MKQITATDFKKQCLAMLDDLDPEGIVITRHGKPVARLVPYEAPSATMIGSMKGRLRINGDLLSTGQEWHVLF